MGKGLRVHLIYGGRLHGGRSLNAVRGVESMMRKVWKLLQAEWLRWFGWRVIVHWEGDRFEHLCSSRASALDWMRQYPQDASVFVYEFDRADFGRAAQ